MFVGIMKTDNGTHPPAKWAAVTAGQIIQIGETATGIEAVFARRMELKLLDILEEAHTQVQNAEKTAIGTMAEAHLLVPIDPSIHVEAPVQAIVAAAKGTPFEAHFALPETVTYIRNLLSQHFGTAMHIERKTFADKVPDHPHAKAYVARYVKGVVVQAPAQ